jgi:hypothetical protein
MARTRPESGVLPTVVEKREHGPIVIAVELAAGLVEGATPALAPP